MDPGITEEARYNPQFDFGNKARNDLSQPYESVFQPPIHFLPQQGSFNSQLSAHPSHYEGLNSGYSSGGNREMGGFTNQQSADDITPANQNKISNDKVSVCCRWCDFCNFKHQECASFGAIFNLALIVISFVLLAAKEKIEKVIQDSSLGFNMSSKEIAEECFYVGRISGSPGSDARLAVAILLLCIYTVGSILFTVAVFIKDVSLKYRSLFIFVFIATCASFPLTYLIPLIIDLVLCPQSAVRFAALFFVYFTVQVVILVYDIQISMVYNQWIKENSQVTAKSKTEAP